MVTGVETAGLVLGSIPLILAGLQFYARGIAVSKRCWKYREQFQRLIVELGTENTICSNSLNLLLVGIVKQKDMGDFLADPSGQRWNDTAFDQALKQRLGTSHESYIATIEELRKTLEVFKQRLKLDPVTGKPQFTEESTFRKYYKRLDFSLKKTDYDDLMTALRRANFSLHRMTTQTISLHSMQGAVKPANQQVPNFKAIHDRAQGFHSILETSWKCPCHANHSVNLRLEPRIDDVQSDEDTDDDKEEMRDPFHVVFRYSQLVALTSTTPKLTRKPWMWEEASVQITVENANTVDSIPPPVTHACQKKLRFANQAQKAVKAALNPSPNLRPIHDLCTAIGTLQAPQRDVCLSLLAKEYAKQKYGILIYPSPNPPVNPEAWSVSTLRSVLEDTGFARRDRLRLAITLASSVLQLHETPWLDENWGKDDILFIKRSQKTDYEHPFVSQKFDQAGQPPPSGLSPSLSRIIRNQTLYALGVSLIELWYGKSLSDLYKPEDGPRGDRMTDWTTADRLVEELYNEAGGKYSDAVRRCIRCDFDRRASNLEDVAFQKAVYLGVVTQLKENFDFLYRQAWL